MIYDDWDWPTTLFFTAVGIVISLGISWLLAMMDEPRAVWFWGLFGITP